MKKILGIIVLIFLMSGNAFAAKRVCVAIHNQYLTIDKPVLLAKRKMLFDAVGCQKGNDLTNIEDYTIYKFTGRDAIFKKLYPNVIGRGVPNWDKWSLDELEKALGERDYKFFNLPNSQERKIIAEKKKKEIEKKKKEKQIADQKKKDKRESIDLAATLYYWGLSTDKISMYFFGNRNQNNLQGTMAIVDENYLPWHGIFGISTKDYEKFDITAQTKSGTIIEFTAKNLKKQKIKLNFDNRTATLIDSAGNKSSLRLKKPEKLFAANTFDTDKPDEKKPKKKKPNDDSIIAAASGTGFFVSRTGHVITNYHVIEGCDANKLTFKGKEIKADTLAVDKMNDLAILKANLRPPKIYPVATEDAALLEDIIIAGYPLGKKVSAAIKTSKGSVTALAGFGDNFSEFQTDAALNQGNSGGPIMNQKGNVVGVAVANYGKKEGVESFNFGIKSSTLRTFANANGLKFVAPNRRDLSNKDLGELITSGTVYLECFMTVAKIKRMLAEAENRKAFFSEHE